MKKKLRRPTNRRRTLRRRVDRHPVMRIARWIWCSPTAMTAVRMGLFAVTYAGILYGTVNSFDDDELHEILYAVSVAFGVNTLRPRA